MKSATFRMICRFLVVSVLLLPLPNVHAGMIGTDRAASAAIPAADRAAVTDFLGRSEVASQLQAMGLDARTAGDRIAAMTDEEVRALAGKIDSLPAGAINSGVWAFALFVAVLFLGPLSESRAGVSREMTRGTRALRQLNCKGAHSSQYLGFFPLSCC